jgi:hypothetical protein
MDESWNIGMNKAAIGTQWHSKQVSAARISTQQKGHSISEVDTTMQQLSKHAPTVTGTHTTEELLEAMSSVQSVTRLYSNDEQDKLLMSQKSMIRSRRSESATKILSRNVKRHYRGMISEDLVLSVMIW